MNTLFGEHAAQLILEQIREILRTAEQRNVYPNGKNLRWCRESISATNESVVFPPTGFLTS